MIGLTWVNRTVCQSLSGFLNAKFPFLSEYISLPVFIFIKLYNFTGVRASGVLIVYCYSAVSFGPKLYDHTHQLHNPITHLFYPPNILHNHCLQVLLGHEDVLREIKNNAYTNFWGVKEVYYGICVSSKYIFFPFLVFAGNQGSAVKKTPGTQNVYNVSEIFSGCK